MAVVVALLAACGAPQPTATMGPTSEPAVIPTDTPPVPAEADAGISVTFDGDACSYEGPKTISAGPVRFHWKIEGESRDAYGLALLTLDEDKTFDDLDAWSSTDQPPWSYHITFRERCPSDLSPFEVRLKEGRPIFVVCFTRDPEAKVGVCGPFQVEG